MDAAVRAAIEIAPAAGTRERIIDLTTTGRRTGRPRRIDIFFYRASGRTCLCSGTSGRPTSWYANLMAHPDFTFHLKPGIRADLPARAVPVTDEEERRRIITEIVTDLNQPHNPGTLAQPTHVRDWLDSRLARVTFL
ncbi:nitroreductase family deazaflavin-dependent oxidoreductase [Streptomyces sp. NPDC003247]|uniref:nitroreductase family deazaflavin-dependent oxidoreductase n=1 Tax=Streptomyces sp. NPDC003247 TaxID=3364677 RepID=UPI003682623D